MKTSSLSKLVLVLCLAVVSLTTLAMPLPTVKESLSIVKTQSGDIRGKVLDSGVKAWLGVPFAEAPVRGLRWEPPQNVSWQGVYNADRVAPQCIQPLRASNINHYFGHEATSEDCLYLNIWAPEKAKKGEKLPVVVWIHGGGFTIGSPSMRNYGGEQLSKKGVIYVSIAYRLGLLGFLAHPELTENSPHNASGNYGLLDQVAALEWIQKNIAEFGGDPERVTIMGQSAGSGSVSYLQVSPLARGLFQRIVGMSGSAFMRPITSREEGEEVGLAVQKSFGAASIAELKHVSADRILKSQLDCQLGCSGEFRAGPVLDGFFLNENPTKAFKNGHFQDVPVMIGFTKDEGFSRIGTAKDQQQLQNMVKQAYGSNAKELLSLYNANDDRQAEQMAKQIARDSTLGLSMWLWGKYQSQYAKSPAYAYLYSRRHPYTKGVTFADHNPDVVGAYHTADVPYWLQTQDSLNIYRETRTYTQFDRQLADVMSDAIVNFAATGNPSHKQLQWPELEMSNPHIVNFGDNTSQLSQDIVWPNYKKLDFFIQHPVLPAPPNPSKEMRSRD